MKVCLNIFFTFYLISAIILGSPLEVITKKREALHGEPWPLSPPSICVKAADKVYGLGTSNMKEITIKRIGWKQDILI